MAGEERLGVDVVTLVVLKDELPIVEQMKKKRWMVADQPCYMDLPE